MCFYQSPSFLYRWRFNRECRVLWRCSDDECIVYNASSSQTHYLNELGAEALRQLEHRSFNVRELIEHFSTQYEVFSSDAEALRYVRKLLSDLDDLGLIEPYSE